MDHKAIYPLRRPSVSCCPSPLSPRHRSTFWRPVHSYSRVVVIESGSQQQTRMRTTCERASRSSSQQHRATDSSCTTQVAQVYKNSCFVSLIAITHHYEAQVSPQLGARCKHPVTAGQNLDILTLCAEDSRQDGRCQGQDARAYARADPTA